MECSAEDCYFIFPYEECDHLVQRVANFFLKDRMVNILVFLGHKVFPAYSQLCHVAQKQPWTMRKECNYLCSGKSLLIETGGLTLFFSTQIEEVIVLLVWAAPLISTYCNWN